MVNSEIGAVIERVRSRFEWLSSTEARDVGMLLDHVAALQAENAGLRTREAESLKMLESMLEFGEYRGPGPSLGELQRFVKKMRDAIAKEPE